ncbi:MAG: glycosyltransferase family 39 protein [Dokdonella sp.]
MVAFGARLKRDATTIPTSHASGIVWQRVFWIGLIAVTLVKIVLAATLQPFGDEAFYWQESRHLAWSYSDLPPLTALLIRFGEAIFGHGVLAMRAPFLLLGALLPLLVARFSRRLFGTAVAWQAGCWALIVPLIASLGLLALPDVPLTVFALLAIYFLDRAIGTGDLPRTQSLREWVVLGSVLALAWLTHLRAGMFWIAALIFMLVTTRGRTLWKLPGAWLAAAIAMIGLLPLVIDTQVGAGSLRFQLIDRHPWSFHADALRQPIEQALAVTPLLYLLLLAVMLIALIRMFRAGFGRAPWDLLGVTSAVFLLGYFALGLFADDTRFRVHWPLPGYLPLLAALPGLIGEWQARAKFTNLVRWLVGISGALAIVGSISVLGYFALAASSGGAAILDKYKAFPENFVGWGEAGAETRRLLQQPQFANALVVADNFMLAAELDFDLDGTRKIYSFDHPLNTRHGRAAQLATWSLDESALRTHAGESVLLIVEETAERQQDRVEWLNSLCGRIDDMQLLSRIDLFGDRRRFAFYRGRVPASDAPARSCTYVRAD